MYNTSTPSSRDTSLPLESILTEWFQAATLRLMEVQTTKLCPDAFFVIFYLVPCEAVQLQAEPFGWVHILKSWIALILVYL